MINAQLSRLFILNMKLKSNKKTINNKHLIIHLNAGNIYYRHINIIGNGK